MEPPVSFESGFAHQQAGRLGEAIAIYERLQAAGRSDWALLQNLGVALRDIDRIEDAVGVLEAAARLCPLEPMTLSALGWAYSVLQRAPEGIPLLRRALDLAPQDDGIAFRLSMSLMQIGRYEEAWPLFERRPGVDKIPLSGVSYPKWRGEPLAGKSIVVWGEQGLGDEIQMGRFLRPLRDLGAAKITAIVSPPNMRLFQRLGADEVLSRHGELRLPRHHYWSPLMSLPLCLGLTLDSLSGAPYLASQDDGLRKGVGVAWQGNPSNPYEGWRSIKDDRLLTAIPDAVPLQPAGDTLDSLEAVSRLKAVVAVDTSWGHLAGAAGIPCHMLLSSRTGDWRWIVGSAQTPWYENHRVHWQTTLGDWSGPIASAVSALG